MAETESFQPDWASPPGDTILEILAEKGITWRVWEVANLCNFHYQSECWVAMIAITIILANR